MIGLSQVATFVALLVGLTTLWAVLKKPIQSILDTIKQHGIMIEESNKRHDKAINAILSNEISRMHKEYTMIGSIDRLALQSVINLYEQYKALGGNGYIDSEMNDLKSLPVILPEAIEVLYHKKRSGADAVKRG